MDQWVQKLSLVVLLLLVVLCVNGGNREITCHTPAYFTNGHTLHAQLMCAKPDAFTFTVDAIGKAQENMTLWTSHIGPKSAWLLKLVFVELIAVCTAYCLIGWIVATSRFDALSPHEELHKSYIKVPMYFLIQVVCGFCWMIFAILSYQENEFPTDQSFLCDYQVRQMGNVHRFTHQCIDANDHFLRAAYMINGGLALVVTLTKVIHVVSALVIGPFLGLKAARAALMQSGVIQNPWALGVGFAFSDLYFAMLTGGKGSPLDRSNVGSNGGGQGVGSKDAELELLVQSERQRLSHND